MRPGLALRAFATAVACVALAHGPAHAAPAADSLAAKFPDIAILCYHDVTDGTVTPSGLHGS